MPFPNRLAGQHAKAHWPHPYRPRLEVLESRDLPSTVTNLDDAGDGSLRQAILDTPAGGTVDFQPGLTGTITLTTGELLINKDLTIAGPGADLITVSGNGASRVFEIADPFTVGISALTIAHGSVTDGNGGGIANFGALTLANCVLSDNSITGTSGAGLGGGVYSFLGTLTITNTTLSGNSANFGGGIRDFGGTVTVTGSTLSGNSANLGGGIASDGTLTVSNSTLSGNSAISGGGIYNYNSDTSTVSNSTLCGNTASGSYPFGGGGIDNYLGTLTVSNSTLSGNSATNSFGGAIFNFSGALTVSNSTLSGNSAGYDGGGIDASYPVTLTNVTLTANRATYYGGGLYVSYFFSPVLHNTLVAGNFRGATGTTPDDVYGSLDAGGDYNLIGDGSGMIGLSNGVNGNLVGSADNPIDPLLEPLDDNGGPTLTHALLPGSPAIDAGNNAYATDWDQRGPGYPRIVNGIIDIGAFEVQARGHGRPTGQPLPDPVAVQPVGTVGGPLLGQPPELPGDSSPFSGPGIPDGQTGQPEPVAVSTAGGQPAPATLLGTYPGTGRPVPSLGSWSANDLDALVLNLLGGP
jgi:hypothetical protein